MKRWLKVVILTYLSLLFFGSFIAVGMLGTGTLEKFLPFISEIKIFLYYFFAGAIGGSLRHLYMFCTHYMDDELHDYRKWIMYIFYPIFATGTAVVAVTIIQSGILLIQFTDYQDTPYAPISIAFFVGFGFNRFVKKLNTVSKDIFQTNRKKSNGDEETIDEPEETTNEQSESLNHPSNNGSK
ncbi:hypothetical protein L1999_18435 [Neobacillus drentensis]|uniref:hypothetical protein n=1 Tax=Neobacillus drentensis TaxID=220684 RepID=UPI001F483D45|nr:hypothetical protein [Neobacillus drentensis]ULT55101.1 hypothetical protein L1999_18435 [Neobacillus drentensis]